MKNKFTFLLLFIFWLSTTLSFSQTIDFQPKDTVIFGKYATYIQPFQSKSKQLILQKTADFFLETAYVGGTLDKNDTEKLVVNLRELDCVTFVETVMALTNSVVSGNFSFDNFVEQLQKIRYRNGILNGYDSRLHYTSDWVHNNMKKNLISDISKDLCGVLETKTIDFMSSHQSAYNALKENEKMLQKIREMEDNINARGGFYYLPKGKIAKNAAKIPHMAMIAFVTSIKGLDTSHVGFAYKKNGKLTFIHASSAKKKVVVDEKSLSDYCKAQKSCAGIIVAKVN